MPSQYIYTFQGFTTITQGLLDFIACKQFDGAIIQTNVFDII